MATTDLSEDNKKHGKKINILVKEIFKKIENVLQKRWLDILFVAIFIVVLLVEILCLKKPAQEGCTDFRRSIKDSYGRFCNFVDDKFYINNIISIICPIMATVLSISLSVYSDPIYGVRLSIFRNYRKNNNYSLEAMIIIPIIILVACVILYYFCLFLTTLVLNLFALTYYIYFIVKEVRFISSGEKQRVKTMQNVYSSYEKMNNNPNNDNRAFTIDRKNITTILTSFINENGLDSAYERLDFKNLNTLNQLLDLNSTYVVDNRMANPEVFYKIKNDYIVNILSYTKILYDIEIPRTSSEGDKRPFFNAINVIQNYYSDSELLNEWHENIYFISCLLFPRADYLKKANDKDKYLLNLSNNVLINSLLSQKLWYFSILFECFARNNLDSAFNDKSYMIFSSVYLFYYLKRSPDKKFTEEIETLFKEKGKEVLKDIFWGYRYDFGQYIELLNALLTFSKEIGNVYYWCTIAGRTKIGKIFSSDYLIYWWVEFLLRGFAEIPEDFQQKFKDVLSDEELNCLSFAISDFNSGESDVFTELGEYFNLIGLKPADKDNTFVKERFLKPLTPFATAELSKLKAESYVAIQFDEENYTNLLDDLKTNIKIFPFYDESVEIRENTSNKLDYDFVIYFGNMNNFVSRFSVTLRELLFMDFSNIKHKKTQVSISEELVKDLIFNYEKTTDGSFENVFYDQYNKKYSYKEGSIKINVSLSDDSKCRKLNDQEIDDYIRQNYSEIDGLYAYYVPILNEKNVLYLTREQLTEVIRNQYCYLSLHITYSTSYSFEDMFTLNEDSGNDNEGK